VKIEKAIEILTRYTGGGNPWSLTDLTEASKLGIEALKAVQYVRRNYADILVTKLPGETED